MSNSAKSIEHSALADRAKQPEPAFTPTLHEQLPEKLLTFRAVAEILGLPLYLIRRAARAGCFPVYRIGRRWVKLSEVLAAIENSREGGQQ